MIKNANGSDQIQSLAEDMLKHDVTVIQSLGNLTRSSSQNGHGTMGEEQEPNKEGKLQRKGPKYERLRLTSGGHESGLHVSLTLPILSFFTP